MMGRWFAGMSAALALATACGDPVSSPCAGVGCSGRGFCVERDGLPECSCLAGYHAVELSCEPNDPTDPCLGVDCSGHGSCRSEAGSPVCDCGAGWVRDPLNPTRCVESGGGDADADADPDADADADPDGLEDATGTDGETTAGCGNGLCDLGETVETCPLDCPTTAEGFSCSSAQVCMECCGDTPTCVETCVAAAAPAERPFARAAEECYLANCTAICGPGWSEACDDCITDHCAESWSACGDLPAGTDGCWTLTDCLWACPANRWTGTPAQCSTDAGILCTDACHRASDRDAVSLARELDACRWLSCNSECEVDEDVCLGCLETRCAAELGTCQTDG